jgi:Uncharacterised nucleotidyltransferase
LHASSARRNRRLFDALEETAAAMRAAGADPVGLKDVALAIDVYPEPALRPMGDIDLLIRREDWDAAASALSQLGFLPRPSADVPYTRAYAPAQHFRRASDEIWIDLQWNVMQREWDCYGEGRFTYDGLGMWKRAVPMKLHEYELRVPTLEDMLFHLCLHLEGHMYSELVLFCDIAELLRRRGDQLDWDLLMRITHDNRAESSVYYVLLLTGRLLGAVAPAGVLEQLEPEYFHGALLEPVFSNLTPLHLSLDEIRLAAAPPAALMCELERVVRRQTARALRLERELDQLATRFVRRGGRLIVFDGLASPRVFPDTSLRGFEPLHAYVLADDAHLLAPIGTAPLTVSTQDPVLTAERVNLTLARELSCELEPLLAARAPQMPTNARAALRSLRDHIAGSRTDDRQATVRLTVHALSAEELIVALAARAGSAAENRLFHQCAVIELLHRLNGGFDIGQVIGLARRFGVQEPVAAGLLIASELGGEFELPSLGSSPTTPPRLLEWARYGPSSLRRYPWLRRAYYFAFAMLATQGVRTRLRYLRRSIRRDAVSHAALLPSLMREIVTGALRSGRESTSPLQELAHWIEPEVVSVLESRHDRAGS